MTSAKNFATEFSFFGFSYFYGYGFLAMKKTNSDLRE